MNQGKTWVPGITPLSVVTILLGLVVIGFMIQVGNMHAGASFLIGGLFSLPIRPIMFIAPLILLSGLVFHLTRRSIYSRAEMVCILSSLLLAPPIMTEGFWNGALGGMFTIPQASDMSKLDALSHRMWPHGENLLEHSLDRNQEGGLATRGALTWPEHEVNRGERTEVPLLVNDQPDAVSFLRIPLPLFKDGQLHLMPEEPYLLTLLVRAEGLQAESLYYCRIYLDETEQFSSEVFSSREPASPGLLHPDGFIRKGSYGITFAAATEKTAYIELGLQGRGRVAFADPSLVSVSVVEELFDGRKVVSREAYEQTPEKLRGRLLVRPDSLFSLEGARFILGGGIPWREWRDPVIFWLGYVLLLLGGTMAIAVIMRRQWIENERFPLPVAQIPIRMLGLDRPPGPEANNAALPAIWKDRLMWAAFGITVFWCLMKVWAAYNSSVPNLSINVPIGPYFSDPSWGEMWSGVNLKVCSIFLGLALFMELNILLTIVIGFFLFRAQYWFGYAQGLTSMSEYPFHPDQVNGAYLAYGLLVLFFARKYLWSVLRIAVRGYRPEDGAREAISYRSCLIGLILCYAGVAWWADWAGLGVGGMLLFYSVMLLVSLVAAKLRAECGVPFSTYFPWSILLLVPLLGGSSLVVPGGFIFLCVIAELLVIRPFLLLPGIQVEVLEMGRRAGVVPRHLLYVCVLGIVGAWLIGGWFLLSNAYSTGLDDMNVPNSSVAKPHWFNSYNSYIRKADQAAIAPGPDAVEASAGKKFWSDPGVWGTAYGAGTVSLVAVLRQYFAGFWFHPIGMIVGSTWMAQEAWGSLLLAWLIRLLVLKIGGAASVRAKLLPAATGIFLGGTASYFLYFVIVSYLKFFVPGTKSVWWSIWAL